MKSRGMVCPPITFFIPLENTPWLVTGLYPTNTGFNCEFSNGIHLLREGGKPENCKNDKIEINQQMEASDGKDSNE